LFYCSGILKSQEMLKRIILFLSCIGIGVQAQYLGDATSYYKFNGDAVDEVSANNGSVTGATSGATGKLGTAYTYDGSADYITLPDVAALQMYNQDFTIAVWIYPTQYNGDDYRCVVGGETGSATLVIDVTTTYLYLKMMGSYDSPAGPAVTLNTWNLIAASFDTDASSNNLILYVNGNASTVTFNHDFTSGAASNFIGGRELNNDYFIGIIDDLGFWKGLTMTTTQLDSLYNSGNGCVYPFDCWPEAGGYDYGELYYLTFGDKYYAYQFGDNYYSKDFAYVTPEYGNFTIYNSWDFESETLGEYTEAEIRDDFSTMPSHYRGHLQNHNTTYIVDDTINGVETQALRVTETGGALNYGLDLQTYLGQDYDEIYLTYNIKLSNNFNSTAGGKFPGFLGFPTTPANLCPNVDSGFVCKPNFQQAGSIFSYHYDRTGSPYGGYPSWCPYGYADYDYDTVFLNNGNWYNITQRIVMNTFTGGVANSDGIYEMWVDGHLMFSEDWHKFQIADEDTMGIDGIHIALWYGGDGVDYTPITTCYFYLDNVSVWIPYDDSISGHELHYPYSILPTPDPITSKDFVYDDLITSPGTLHNVQYGSSYSACKDEVYLIDAGANHTVSYNVTAGIIGGGDYLFFYDGKTTTADLIDAVIGYDATITGTRTSTGRYMTVRFSSDVSAGLSTWGFTGTVTFNEVYAETPPSEYDFELHYDDDTWSDDISDYFGNLTTQTSCASADSNYYEITDDPVYGASNQVLHARIEGGCDYSGRIQGTIGNFDADTFHFRQRYFIGDDLEFLVSRSTYCWYSLIELWEQHDPVLDGDVAGKARYSLSMIKNPGAGPLVWWANGEKRQPASAQGTYMYHQSNTDVSVPYGEWFTIDFFLKRAQSPNGEFRATIQVDGQAQETLFNLTGISTEYPTSYLPIHYFQPWKFYTNIEVVNLINSLGGEMDQYYDDFYWY
jgi:hypothetical protein